MADWRQLCPQRTAEFGPAVWQDGGTAATSAEKSTSVCCRIDFPAVRRAGFWYLLRFGGSSGGMDIWRNVKRQARAAVAPVVFLSLTAYFGWHASQGDRGLVSYAERQKDLVLARAQLERAQMEVVLWDRRVAGLRGARLDRDALDERARAMLNVSEPNDVIMMYPNGQRLF